MISLLMLTSWESVFKCLLEVFMYKKYRKLTKIIIKKNVFVFNFNKSKN